jgi:hypothetical protein
MCSALAARPSMTDIMCVACLGARPGSDGHICTYITMRIQVTYHIPLRLQPIFCRTVVPVPTTCSRTRYENQEATELLLRIPL